MKTLSTTLVHTVLQPRRKTIVPPPVLVMLHGRGADEKDLLGIAEYLDDRFFVVSARAPFNFGQSGGYTWYDLIELGMPEPVMFGESYRKLAQFVDDVAINYPVDRSKFILFGFSMGTIMSYALSMTSAGRIAGVIANSGLVPEHNALKFEWEKLRGKPYFVAHGLYDPVIPVSFARRARELLTEHQAEVSYHEYEAGHEIPDESLNDMNSWLAHLIDQPAGRAPQA